MAFPMSVTELTIRVGEAPLSSTCCPPVNHRQKFQPNKPFQFQEQFFTRDETTKNSRFLKPKLPDMIVDRSDVTYGSQKVLDNPWGSHFHLQNQETSQQLIRNKNNKQILKHQPQATGSIRQRDERNKDGGEEMIQRASMDMSSHLVLTPFGPLPWNEMVQNGQPPHFLLVPTTPIKATWLTNPSLISSFNKNIEDEMKGSHSTNIHNDYYIDSERPIESHDRINYVQGNREVNNYNIRNENEYLFSENEAVVGSNYQEQGNYRPENERHSIERTQFHTQEDQDNQFAYSHTNIFANKTIYNLRSGKHQEETTIVNVPKNLVRRHPNVASSVNTMSFRSPTSFHIQTFPINKSSEIRSDYISKPNQENRSPPKTHNVPEAVHPLYDDTKSYVEFTELDASNANRTNFGFSNFQHNAREPKGPTESKSKYLPPAYIGSEERYPPLYPLNDDNFASYHDFSEEIGKEKSKGFNEPTGGRDIFSHVGSAIENADDKNLERNNLPYYTPDSLYFNNQPKMDTSTNTRDVYSPASELQNKIFQNAPDESKGTPNLFDLRHTSKSARPIMYIKYTTKPAINHSSDDVRDKDKIISQYKQNPFFQNFGPFPEFKVNSNQEVIDGNESRDSLVFVTPHPSNYTTSTQNEEIGAFSNTVPVSGQVSPMSITNPHGVYFIPSESRDKVIDSSSVNDSRSLLKEEGKNGWIYFEENTNDSVTETNDDQDNKGIKNHSAIASNLFDNTEQSVDSTEDVSTDTDITNDITMQESVTDYDTIPKTYQYEESDSINAHNIESSRGHYEVDDYYGSYVDEEVPSQVSNLTILEKVHRTGGTLLDAIVNMVKEDSKSNDSLRGLFPPFSVLEVGVGESIVSPELSAEVEGSSTSLPLPDTGFGPILQVGIVLGVVIVVAVVLFHSHHIRKECCSQEKKDKLRQLKKRYREETSGPDTPMTSSGTKNNNSYSIKNDKVAATIDNKPDKTMTMKSFIKNSKVNSNRRDVSEEDRSDGDSNYAHVIDVTL